MPSACYFTRHARDSLAILAIAICCVSGCTRKHYRVQADMEAYSVIDERNHDQRWTSPDVCIDIDPRSRYYDPYDPDCNPIPQDDPTARAYMEMVDGKKGWDHWYDFGERNELENPVWVAALGDYMDVADDGTVRINIESALRLAYVHSPSHQSQLETLYLSALDVSAERFRLDAQFFGGYDTVYNHNGKLIPAGLGTGPFEGSETNLLTVGRPSSGNPALQFRRRFATAGELLVGFANSFVFEFTGSDTNISSSIANFTLVQPLLRGAGRDIALEQLTSSERALLSNLRAYAQFRQGFYTQIAVGEVGVAGPRRGGPSTFVQVSSQTSGVGGFIGLLRQVQSIRNAENNLKLQLRTLEQLEAFLDVGVIDLVQVDQFRQDVESSKANLANIQNDYQTALDSYKTNTLGLPPNVLIDIDQSLIQRFQLLSVESTAVLDAITALQDRIGQVPPDAELEVVQEVLNQTFNLIDPVREQFNGAERDLAKLELVVPERESQMTDKEKDDFKADRESLLKNLKELRQNYTKAKEELETIRDELDENTRAATMRKIIIWLAKLVRLIERSAVLVQARARLESITIEPIAVEADEAYQVALEERLDFMNGRVALVDSWRQTQIAADALQSVVNITSSGDIRTARNNPLSFRAPTGRFRLGLEFDAPLTRLLERNSYREAQINFQRNRRTFIQSRDALFFGLRDLIRAAELLQFNLEVNRRAVAIAIRQIDSTRADLYEPVPPAQPGQPAAQFRPTTAFNLTRSLSSLRRTQDQLMNVWLSYYAVRMRLQREMGIMRLDGEGRWIDASAGPGKASAAEEVTGPASTLLAPQPIEPEVADDELEALPPIGD